MLLSCWCLLNDSDCSSIEYMFNRSGQGITAEEWQIRLLFYGNSHLTTNIFDTA
jgi:hypothetical protein